MPFKKGESGNPEGRKKGSQNKINATLRQKVDQLINDNYEKIVADLSELSAERRVDFWIKLLEYSIPKQQRTALANDPDNPLINEDFTSKLADLFDRKVNEIRSKRPGGKRGTKRAKS